MDVNNILSQMTTEEKVALVSGTDFMYTNPIPRLNVPSLCMSDGPHGLRIQTNSRDNGVSASEPATAFPTAACSASSWNPDNLYKMGKAIAEECKYYGVHTLLGPGVNIKRNPLCGRNFEYFSEDPLLAGMLGTQMVNGLQDNGIGVSLKHFALNNSENNRFYGDSIASEKTMRNIYLKPFEYIVKHSHPSTIMCAYNKINGTHCSENKHLLTEILRDDWGYDGVVVSDWGAVRDRTLSIQAGLDLEMPGDTKICRRQLLDNIANGTLDVKDLDKACLNILKWIDKYYTPKQETQVDWEKHHELACDIAVDSAVLLKNDGILPLTGNEKVHISGPLFENLRYQGAGSSMINPTKVTTVKDVFDLHNIKNESLSDCDTILVFAGLTDEYESEGKDRCNMRLPQDQLDLIDDLIKTEKKIVVILFGGSCVELPFCSNVSAILNMYLPGQNGGNAVYQLLYGEKNPSGKLAETWPYRYEDVPNYSTFGKSLTEIYKEGCDVGYRYYSKHDIPVRFPFGFGLSYTTFKQTECIKNGNVYTQTITYTGSRYGAEVAQLFIDGELKGFKKVYLNPNESQTISITVDFEEEKSYSDEYIIPEEKPKYPITIESRFTDLKLSFMGRILYNAVMSVPRKQEKKAQKMEDGPEKENMKKGAQFLKEVLDSNSLRTLSMCARDSMPYNIAQGFVEMANNHFLKGIRCFLTKIKVPKLPKEEI